MSKTYFEARKWASFALKANPEFNTLADVDFIMTHLLNLSKVQLLINNQAEMPAADLQLFENVVNEIVAGTPPQYAIGKADFYGMSLEVTPDVLIPRVETEELVDWVLENTESRSNEPLKVLDIGTGSGAIALAIKQNRPEFNVSASDISVSALHVAQRNANKLGLNVQFIESDVFSNITEEYDVIVSNPPYISESERGVMGESVITYEPHLALFAEDNGLAIYKRIAAGLSTRLLQNGQAFFEIGYQQQQSVIDLFVAANPELSVTARHDVAGNQRMIKVAK